MAKDALRASSTAPCTCVAESWVRSKFLTSAMPLHIFQHLGHKPLVGIELPLGKGLLRPLHGGVDGEEQQQSRQRNKPHTPVKEEHHHRDDAGGQKAACVTITTRVATFAMFSMVLVVTEVTSPRLLSLNQPIGR